MTVVVYHLNIYETLNKIKMTPRGEFHLLFLHYGKDFEENSTWVWSPPSIPSLLYVRPDRNPIDHFAPRAVLTNLCTMYYYYYGTTTAQTEILST